MDVNPDSSHSAWSNMRAGVGVFIWDCNYVMTTLHSQDEELIQGREKPLLSQLESKSFELDQKLHQAIKTACEWSANPYDSEIFHALNRQNVITTRLIDIDRKNQRSGLPFYLVLGKSEAAIRGDPYRALTTKSLTRVLNRAIATRRDRGTLATGDFVRSIAELSIEGTGIRTANLLAYILSGAEERNLRALPEMRRLLEAIRQDQTVCDDYQYILTLEKDRVVFRVTSTLSDFVQRNDSGLLTPHRALLTRLSEQFGAITPDQLAELESLLNSKKVRETDFQTFFERNPHFFRRWDFREVHPHVFLTRTEAGPMIPDFILTDRNLQQAMVLELKLPQPKLVCRQQNRERFSTAISEARAQLFRYRDWFRDPYNRRKLQPVVGMEIYEPRLAVIVGRSKEFLDDMDRQRLRSDNPDIEVVTYDDIVADAKRRLVFIESA